MPRLALALLLAATLLAACDDPDQMKHDSKPSTERSHEGGGSY